MADSSENTEFAARLLEWFAANGRKDLPWQHNPTPYRVWVSEIMLQQTQVATVIPYYERFMTRFPDVAALAKADIDDVLHHWSGLGYYARARNLHRAARTVIDAYGGHFPSTFEDVVDLPGIGRSTAGAILALSRNERHPILDGNAKRVLARYHAVDGWPGQTKVSQILWRHAERNTPASSSAEFTQAIMDLGATVCTRSRPLCDRCPFETDCIAHRRKQEADYPGRRPKKDKPLKKTQMVLVYAGDSVYLERRPPSGIWGGLWSFPEIEPQADATLWCQQTLNASPAELQKWQTVRHSFSHYDLDIEPIAIRVQSADSLVADSADRTWYEMAAPPAIGLAAPVSSLISKLRSAMR